MLSCYTLGYRQMPLLSPGLIQLCKGFWDGKQKIISFDKEALFQLIWCNFVKNCYVMCLYMAGGITRIMF